ncbi:ComEA family DNA-binding protein [Lactiplantibacillus plajomi]|uniref:Helix-hairpin-helix domain-containing protein n=1 Tax=Lactiplantibacillus plajomi TaxID=1457217 RepID=A0ABV6K414_9LACO|nr:ComEA family DNA-binding protein [Lactiplantibacillus plajomi]
MIEEAWEWIQQHLRLALGLAVVMLLGVGTIWWLGRPTPASLGIGEPALAADQAAGLAAKPRPTRANRQLETSGPLYVDVKGAVRQPGLYQVQARMRVADVIKLAGGLLAQADQRQVNLAAKLTDQQVVYVPVKGETPPAGLVTSGPVTATAGSNAQQRVNLNTADVAAFQTLSGIGAKKAQKIVDYRQQHGPFKRVEDLQQVSGFGAKTIAKFKDQLSV